MTPFQRLSEEMGNSPESVLTPAQYASAIDGLLGHLSDRAQALMINPNTQEALDAATHYMVAAQTFNHYGTALIAMDDIEESQIGVFTPDEDDENPPPEDIN